LAIKQRDATRKQIIALLLELNFRSPNSVAGTIGKIDDIVEDDENGLSAALRRALNAAKEQFECMVKTIETHDKCLEQSIQTHHDCKKLLKLEGVGPINAVNLYISLGCAELGTFSKGKEASACIGLTPIQHTSGGKVKLGTIGKQCRNSMLRAQLIGEAMSVVRQVVKREAKTKKEMWLKALAERRGNKCAAVALANKTVRTAFAMLTQGTEYKAELLAT
jgi:transposase